ncbi:hypothetical protein ACFLQR_03250 [Verrucomicrobiota bacterium]
MDPMPYVPVMAGVSEVVIWIALAVGWVVIQAIVKGRRASSDGSSQSDRSSPPATDLDKFLADITGQSSEPEMPPETDAVPPALETQIPVTAFAAPPPPQPEQYVSRTPPPAPVPPPVTSFAEGNPAEGKVPSLRVRPGKREVVEPAPALTRAKARVKGLMFSTTSMGTGRKKAGTSRLRKSLTAPGDWRHAIVYREIMGPPKALRELAELTTLGRGD